MKLIDSNIMLTASVALVMAAGLSSSFIVASIKLCSSTSSISFQILKVHHTKYYWIHLEGLS